MTSALDEKWRPFNCFLSRVGLRTYQHPSIRCKLVLQHVSARVQRPIIRGQGSKKIYVSRSMVFDIVPSVRLRSQVKITKIYYDPKPLNFTLHLTPLQRWHFTNGVQTVVNKNINILILPDVSVDRVKKCGALVDAIRTFTSLYDGVQRPAHLQCLFPFTDTALQRAADQLQWCSKYMTDVKNLPPIANTRINKIKNMASPRAPHFWPRSTLTSGSINISIFFLSFLRACLLHSSFITNSCTFVKNNTQFRFKT